MEYQESDDNEQLVILSRSDEIHDDGQYGTHQDRKNNAKQLNDYIKSVSQTNKSDDDIDKQKEYHNLSDYMGEFVSKSGTIQEEGLNKDEIVKDERERGNGMSNRDLNATFGDNYAQSWPSTISHEVVQSANEFKDISPQEKFVTKSDLITFPSADQLQTDQSNSPRAKEIDYEFTNLVSKSHDDEHDDSFDNLSFGNIARPPTPPKQLDDEEMKPSIIEFGPSTHKPSTSENLRSILKQPGQAKISWKPIDPRVLDLIYWKNVKNSATVLSLSLLALIIVAKYSFISLISHVAIGVLIAFFAFRLYKFIECQIQKKDDVNPFESYLNEEIQLPYDRIHQQIDTLIEHLQIIFVQLRRLFLIEQVSDSIKFFLLLWSLTYIGEWFSAICFSIILLLGVFTLPKVYQVHHEIIDHYFAVIKAHVDHAIELLCEKVPFVKKFTHEKVN